MSDGKDCRCNAHCEHECCCDADWTPKEVYDLRAELARVTAERDALAAEIAALKPQSNADEFASIPLRSWVVEVFQHLCHSPHTPDEWKRDLDKKTIALLNAIEQGKKGDGDGK